MPRRSAPPPPPEEVEERIVDVEVATELRGSFLEYAYSVIHSRALPDARDGLKPVHRRILYSMAEMGLRPDRGHVKCARVVGEVMGKLHPHGDGAIYDALVRMAQPFAMRVPLVDGHGNFGSPDDAPAAMRYTECRLAAPATLLTASLDEDVVDLVPSYDGREQQPAVLPAAFPNLLVNGASGIAVGMATNMPPHNLGEVVAAARHLVDHPDATLEDLVRLVPGPDLPTGGRIVGLDGVREAYATGRGSFRTRATARIEDVTARRRGIVITELPYGVGPERVRERVAELVRARKLAGISDIEDFTDGETGLRLVVEVKSGFSPDAVLEELYRLTPLEETFGVNNVALVDGAPRTLGLKELLEVYLAHRFEVVRRRSADRRRRRAARRPRLAGRRGARLGLAAVLQGGRPIARAPAVGVGGRGGPARRRRREERLHLVDGLLVALLDIDEVIQVVRTSDTAADARARLVAVFDLSEVQAQHVLDTPLRRLTRYDRLELEREAARLREEVAELTAILDDDARLREVVSRELAEVAAAHATPRRTVLLESAGLPARAAAGPLEVVDEPCRVLLSSSGLLARSTAERGAASSRRASHDVVVAEAAATTRGEVGAVTSTGRVLRLPVLDLPALPPSTAPTLAGGAPVREFADLLAGERVVGLTALGAAAESGAGLALGTARGVVKRLSADAALPPSGKEVWDVVRLEPGDEVVGAVDLRSGDEDLVLITSDAHLLRFPAGAVRPQGRPAGGMAGIRLAPRTRVVFAGAVDPSGDGGVAVVVTVAGPSGALPGTTPGTAKTAPYAEHPAKGRGTGGVRCHRFLRGEDALLLAWAGPAPARAAGAAGVPVELPAGLAKRDASGSPLAVPVDAVGRAG